MHPHLGRRIPTSLTALDNMFTTRTGGHAHHAAELEQIPPAVRIRIRILNLARETNLPQFLPFTFYLCARLDSDLIFHGTPTDTLSWEDKTICFLGRYKLLQAQRTLTHAFFVDFKSDVRCGTHCPSIFPEIPRRMWEHRVFLHVLTFETYNPACIPFHACAICMHYALMGHREGRARVWSRLPGMFEMGSWEDLRNLENS
jgi:hypothetical protein